MTVRFLEGVTVLDLTRLVPGAICTMHLADYGAEVIKIEEPGRGDYLRWVGDGAGVQGALFGAINKGKRSLVLDLKQRGDVESFLQICAGADVVVEGFRPGVMARLGLGAERLRAISPRLVYCALTGYGQTGPLASKAGHDINYMAVSGILDRCARAGEAPVVPGFPITDVVGGLSAATAILAALMGARATGQGATLDVSMMESAFAHSVMALASRDGTGGFPSRGTDRYSGGHAGYGVYPTEDHRELAVGALEPKFFAQFCEILDLPELAAEPESPATSRRVAEAIAARPLSYWQDRFAGADCCVTPVLSVAEALDEDHVAARDLIETGVQGMPRASVMVDGRRIERRAHVPELGEDSAEIRAACSLGDKT